MNARTSAATSININVAHPARRYDYCWLGGKDHFAADRASGDLIADVFPQIRTAARENRRFLRRAVTYLAGECGIRQFLDIGVGLPCEPNTHDIAQSIAPESRVVYVDNDRCKRVVDTRRFECADVVLPMQAGPRVIAPQAITTTPSYS